MHADPHFIASSEPGIDPVCICTCIDCWSGTRCTCAECSHQLHLGPLLP